MKKLLFATFLSASVLFSALSVSAQFVNQCSQQGNFTPIQCGYYQEGYQDGVSDAQNNRANDFKRYRSKLDGKYESYYQQGYDAGYSSLRPYQKWNNDQRDAYDDGFQDGESDKRRNISRLPERYEGQYNRNFEAFYKQGYYDGFDGRSRQYDMPIGGVSPTNPTFPTNPSIPSNAGTATGTAYWNGRVDDRVNIILKGNQIRTQILGGNTGQPDSQSVNGVLPSRQTTVSVRKSNGRGDVSVIQQPTRANAYTAIIQVVDSRRGADDYRLEIYWESAALIEEPYQSGRVTWKGKADQTVNIVIAGSLVQTQDASGTGISNVSSNISGYLARRPGTVSVRKNKGRGTVSVLQQPTEDNDFVAIVQIFDADKGAGDYELEISW